MCLVSGSVLALTNFVNLILKVQKLLMFRKRIMTYLLCAFCCLAISGTIQAVYAQGETPACTGVYRNIDTFLQDGVKKLTFPRCL